MGTVDRSRWKSGPWDNEPDELDFIHAGLPCALRRNRIGSWCGYVQVPERHPLHKATDYYTVMDRENLTIDVHGGITYNDAAWWESGWWVGFDCAHSDDISPAMTVLDEHYSWGEQYRTMGFARIQCERLAEQIAATTPPDPIDLMIDALEGT